MNYLYLLGLVLATLGLRPDASPAWQTPLAAAPSYPWLSTPPAAQQQLALRFLPPPGCRRVMVAGGSWGAWLRGLPLRPAGTPAHLYTGRLKDNQAVVAAVIAIDAGTKDLQQCADAVIRLRAEYLFSQNFNKIHFHLTTGYDAWFSDYVVGRTFRVQGEQVLPASKPAEAPTHAALGQYLLPVFGYAGTLSLSRELRPVPLEEVRPGDVLIHGGRPGHAVLVADVAEHPQSGQRYLLLAQSYMPAQDIHILRNIAQPALGAWFAVPAPTEPLVETPEWTFARTELGRFE
ncbi:DUF4846 domain-containing protein [Hymenobacter bucti]|uniref:DUF4846 domain-containing protein n=1 Tax=Hymenobacter bucti TaxID=1844114 RepID=A0ABW4R283_9BACT